MKFVHIADMHLDCPFKLLNDRLELGNLRRLEQRKALKRVIDYIKENSIKYLFIAGDLYEHEYINQSTIKYINDLFKSISDTKIFITPGNHDPLLINSFYNKYAWSDNVIIFNSKIRKIQDENVDIYGFGFEDFYMKSNEILDFNIENKEKINILITHGDIANSGSQDKNYNPLDKNIIDSKGFDYIALGHIHKNNFDTNNTVIYPGSTVSLGFDELGKHGMVVGNIDEVTKKVELEFVEIDDKEFCEFSLNVDEIEDKEELADKINSLEVNSNRYYKIILTGKRKFEIKINEIEKMIGNKNIIKIKDQTKLGYDLNEIKNELSLKGMFVQELLNLEKEGIYSKEQIEKAIEIGMEILN